MRHFGWLVLFAAGCGASGTDTGKPSATGGSDAAALAEAAKFVLPAPPAGAKGVMELRADAKAGDEVVIVGRVGGHKKPFTAGRAVFMIVGDNLKPAMECDCPWDYCDAKPGELAKSRATVKFVDGAGNTLLADAKEAFGIKELSTVVVKGKVERDDHGNFTVVGTGLFVQQK